MLALAAGPLTAQIKRPQKAAMELAADRTAYEPGGKAQVAALVTIESGWHVNAHQPTFEYLIPTILDIELPEGWTEETVRYPQAKMQTFAFEAQPLAVYDGDVLLVASLQIPAGTPAGPVPVKASLRYQACNDEQCLPPVTTEAEVALTVGPGGKPQHPSLFSGAAAAPPGDGKPADPIATEEGNETSLGLMLLLGVLGGLILNAMPCVLPILSLKVFGLVRSAAHGRRELVGGMLATAAGILASFWALALAAIAARGAGAAVGWGVQFQQPGFVALLAVVVVLFCLNLWGLFEIPLPQRLARLGGSSPREGMAGHFASGLFATLMATPCSAPFLGTAVGFALAQKAPVILAIFTAVGLGMALPYLLIAVAPGVARLLPKPGGWMETVRGAMGFLLAGAAVWLFYVLAAQVSPEQVAAVQLGLLTLALFTWLQHRVAHGRAMRRVAAFGMAAAAAVVLVAAVKPYTPPAATPGSQVAGAPAGHIAWEPWDRARAESLAAGGQLVFVDVTADWCFTCKVNEKLILDTPDVARGFKEHGVVPMKADWTNRSDEIANFLAEHGRYGIPFYMLYRPGMKPHVFGELPSKEGLIEVVRNAANAANTAGQTVAKTAS
jgi:suppressor for copper-sensitivity B